MKPILLLLLLISPIFAQTPSSLPSYLTGTGLEWNRYAAQPYSNVTSLAIRIGMGNVYSWSTLETPIAKTPSGGTPLSSSLRTGAAYVFAQSADGKVFGFALGDFGLTTTPSSSVAGYSAGLGLAIRIRPGFYIAPLYRMIGAAGGGVRAVPELMLWYSFGK